MDRIKLIASFIHESKKGYPANFAKMHPKERDFWLARAQQAEQGNAHSWACNEADMVLTEARIEAQAREC